MKTIENKCEHKVVKYLGKIKAPEGILISLGKGYYCKENIMVTNKYRKVVGNVYEVKNEKL